MRQRRFWQLPAISSLPGATRRRGGARRGRLAVTALALLMTAFLTARQVPATPRTFTSLAAAADTARDANQLKQAAALYRKALALRPGWAQGWWYLGTIHYDQNQYREAAQAFQHLLEQQPRSGSAHAMLGLCQAELGDERNALENIEEGLRLGIPADAQMKQVLLFHQGMLLRHHGHMEEAADTFATLCAEQVASPSLDRELGLVGLRISGPVPGAPAEAGPIVEALGRAVCLADQSKFDQARRSFADLVRRDPQFPHIHEAYGRFLLKLHDPDGAIAEFKQEITTSPGDVLARLEIAAAEYRVHSAAGLPWAEQAVKLDPKQPLGHYFLGLLLEDTGSFQRAIPELDEASRMLPQDTKLWFALGTAYARTGERQKAAQAFATFQKLRRAAAPAGANTIYGQEPIAPALLPSGNTNPHE